MCYNCGCGVIDDDMGYGEVGKGGGGLTENDMLKMAKITNTTLEDTKKEILKLLQKQIKK